MRITLLTISAVIVGTFMACNKDGKTVNSHNSNPTLKTDNADPIAQMFSNYREANRENFVFSGSKGTVITTSDGIRISVRPNVLRRPDGSVETGMVTMSVFGVMDNASRALGGVPTQSLFLEGVPGSGGGIYTAGAVEINMTNQQGQDLTAQQEGPGVTIDIPVGDTGFDPDMTAWDGTPSPNQPRDNVWEPSENPVTPGEDGASYSTKWVRNGLINIDQIQACPDPKTPYKLKISGPFNQSNTQVYCVAASCKNPGGPNVVFSLDLFDAPTSTWSANPGCNLSIGTTPTFVAISVYNGQLYYGFTTVTVTGGMMVSITNMAPTTMAALTAYLNSL